MLPLTTQFAAEFDGAVQRRGAEYFRSGRVHIDAASESSVTATVRGSTRYQVELQGAGRKLHASCTCPFFDVDFCKHIWAVILTVEKQQLLEGDYRSLVPLDVADVDFEEDSEYERSAGAGNDLASSPAAPAFGRGAPSRMQPQAPHRPREIKAPDWRQQIARLDPKPQVHYPSAEPWPATRELLYVIDLSGAMVEGGLYLEILCRDLKANGEWSKPRPRPLQRDWQQQIPNPTDRQILAFLTGAIPAQSYYEYPSSLGYAPALPSRYSLIDPQPHLLLPLVCQTGRCHLRLLSPGGEAELGRAVLWQEGAPWEFRLEVSRSRDGEHYEISGALRRGEEVMPLSMPVALLAAGVLFTREHATPYEHHGAFNWVALLRSQSPLRVPLAEADEFLGELLRIPTAPPLDLPEELRYEEVVVAPRPRLTIKADKKASYTDQLTGELTFEYGGTIIAQGHPGRGTLQLPERRLLRRDPAESAAERRLHALGCRRTGPDYAHPAPRLTLLARHMPGIVRELLAEGWHVEADGKLYRSPGRFQLQVSSGIDWFELQGTFEFGNTVATLPDLLAAVRRGEDTVRLGDGSFGVLPQEWLRRYGPIVGLGEMQGDQLRFKRCQAGVLDALLAAQPEVRCDELFTRVRGELSRFSSVQSMNAPAGFAGELRSYQKDALGWFEFLRQFGFGGCLADDMGLGKTVQVLALLEGRRELRERYRARNGRRARNGKEGNGVQPVPLAASLVVVPKSLIFNWKAEAARFAPRLRVLDHTGSARVKGWGHFEDYDLVLTTYGTLRIDATDFKDVRFDYLVLDEAQAIKNADSLSAKSVRLLQADHRLALSGTPIENHLGELWSLFEFLNPGMLGAASVFKMAHGAARNPGEDTRELLSRALRPFILRRTKEQVAPELPPRVEQTIYCELDTRQRRLYDQMRGHYRASLLKRIEVSGIGRAKIQILEALLRLRQAAIHPGLLDKDRLAESSAKLDVLLPRVLETIEENHKALVFSQFTGMLAILRQHLDREGVDYEYLDGKTRNREACVERFQTDPHCKLFLISLKAGGLGLNLTAAQYVFLLDPWWNPAVEAQAIDRAHRIGQTNQVFAYRLIARDTVEEKVLELQDTKRDLADAIVGANEGMIRHLAREDLELLLS
jgi:superfamily II DNA or RNA helicase